MMINACEAGNCGKFLSNVLILNPITLKALTTFQKLDCFDELRQKSQGSLSREDMASLCYS